MIYNTSVDNFYSIESYKERNLYYKVFSGYLFNELIEGYNERKNTFFKLLLENCDKEGFLYGDIHAAKERLNKLKDSNVFVTFDFHIKQNIKKIKNRGEMSDILISGNDAYCSIECKYLSNYDYQDDIEEVQKRIKTYSSTFSIEAVQVMLIPKQMHNYSKQSKKIESVECPLVFAHWEQIQELVRGTPVEQYLEVRLMRKKNKK